MRSDCTALAFSSPPRAASTLAMISSVLCAAAFSGHASWKPTRSPKRKMASTEARCAIPCRLVFISVLFADLQSPASDWRLSVGLCHVMCRSSLGQFRCPTGLIAVLLRDKQAEGLLTDLCGMSWGVAQAERCRLAGPEPAKGSCRQQAVYEAIHGFLCGHAPGLPLPDSVADLPKPVGHESGSSRHAKYSKIVRARRNRVSCEVANKESDDKTIAEPLREELRHNGQSNGKNGHHADRSLLIFFLHGGRLHILVRAEWKNIKPTRQAGSSENGPKLVLIGQLPVIALVIGQHGMHDGAGDEHDHSREQDREPQSGERNHVQPPG